MSSIPKLTEKARLSAKIDRLSIYRIEIDDRAAGGGAIATSGVCGPEASKEIHKLLLGLFSGDRRDLHTLRCPVCGWTYYPGNSDFDKAPDPRAWVPAHKIPGAMGKLAVECSGRGEKPIVMNPPPPKAEKKRKKK